MRACVHMCVCVCMHVISEIIALDSAKGVFHVTNKEQNVVKIKPNLYAFNLIFNYFMIFKFTLLLPFQVFFGC